jgi:hypothetical protein
VICFFLFERQVTVKKEVQLLRLQNADFEAKMNAKIESLQIELNKKADSTNAVLWKDQLPFQTSVWNEISRVTNDLPGLESEQNYILKVFSKHFPN